jgi:hypothetical protein
MMFHSVKWIPNIWELQQVGGDEQIAWPPWVGKNTTDIKLYVHPCNFYLSLDLKFGQV